jgi:hypothetical protein
VLDKSGRLVAICEPVGRERVKPVVVVQTSDSSSSGVGPAAGHE